MVMTRLGDGSWNLGLYTGLSKAQEFANAVCHFLCDHPMARSHEGGGKELPLDENVWRDVLKLEYRPEAIKKAQKLEAYCSYYNQGVHGHGHDLDGTIDWAEGRRIKEDQNKGKHVKDIDIELAVHPGTEPPYLTPEEVIEWVRERLPEISTDRGRAAAAKLEAQSRQRKTNRKRAPTRKTKREAKAFNNANASADDVNSIWSRADIDSTTKEKLVQTRLGQGTFRTQVLRLWGNCCCVTVSTTHEAIRASHIKPWRESTDKQRLDPHNGLPLVANLDALFDAGLISFESTGRLIVSSKLDPSERKILGITGNQSLKTRPTKATAAYLADHRRKHGF